MLFNAKRKFKRVFPTSGKLSLRDPCTYGDDCGNTKGFVCVSTREGNIPSNETLIKGIDNLKTSEAVSNTTNNMSPAGQQVMEHVQKTMQTSKKIVEEKNSDQELQTVIQQGFHSGKGAAGKVLLTGEVGCR